MTRGSRLLPGIVGTGLAVHLVLTALDNLPEAKLSLGFRVPMLNRLPQWRFFAPNPGVEDTHFLHRTGDGERWNPWTEIPVRNRLRWYSLLWNPRGRAPKALFDTVQQLRVLAGYGASYEWAASSDAYGLLSDFVRETCRRRGIDDEHVQFMVMTSIPGLGPAGLRPILVSAPLPLRSRNR